MQVWVAAIGFGLAVSSVTSQVIPEPIPVPESNSAPTQEVTPSPQSNPTSPQFRRPANPTPSPVTHAKSTSSWLIYILDILIHIVIGVIAGSLAGLLVLHGPKVARQFCNSGIGKWILKQLADSALEPGAYRARVVLDGLILQDAPSTDANQIGKLVVDQRLVVLEESPEWQRVRLEEVEGWVKANNLERIPTISDSDRALPEQSNNSDTS